MPVDARGWLARIHMAANGRNYQGTMVFSAGGVMSSSRVAHFCVGDQVYERIEALDGRLRQVYRHNDLVHTVWPQAGMAVVERRSLQANLPSATQSVEPRALDQYEFRAEGRDRVAGREAVVFLLQPRDEWRFAQRIWADQETGLMLRSDVLGASRAVLESAAFSEVEVGVRAQPDSVLQPIRKLESLRVLRPAHMPTQLESQGWSLTRMMGRSVFVRKYGILFWGVPTAILWAVAMACLSGFDHLAILLTISLVVSPFSGFCFGHMLWAINERFAPPARSRERRV